MKLISMAGSIILHMLVAFCIFYQVPNLKKPEPETKTSPVTVRLIPKDQILTPSQNISIVQPDSAGIRVDPKICTGKDSTYVGVGFLYQPSSRLVTYVPPSYPAYKAGLRVGDMILNPNVDIVDGHVMFDIRRGFDFLVLRIKVELICFRNN